MQAPALAPAPRVNLLRRIDELKLLTQVSEAGLLSQVRRAARRAAGRALCPTRAQPATPLLLLTALQAEEAGFFSKLEEAGAFSRLEALLPARARSAARAHPAVPAPPWLGRACSQLASRSGWLERAVRAGLAGAARWRLSEHPPRLPEADNALSRAQLRPPPLGSTAPHRPLPPGPSRLRHAVDKFGALTFAETLVNTPVSSLALGAASLLGAETALILLVPDDNAALIVAQVTAGLVALLGAGALAGVGYAVSIVQGDE